ncbi:MAG: hypothetical protein MHMPM18_001327 [Marteilia pararefringens]
MYESFEDGGAAAPAGAYPPDIDPQNSVAAAAAAAEAARDQALQQMSDPPLASANPTMILVIRERQEQPGFCMFLCLGLITVVSPLAFVLLQKFGPSLFRIITLTLMWIVGLLFSLYIKAHFFTCLWVLYTLANLYMYRISKSKDLAKNAPRIIYKFYLMAFKVNYFFSIVSLIAFCLASIFTDIPDAETPTPFLDFSFYIFICSIYFGILCRDFAEICAETIAIKSGHFTPGYLAKTSYNETMCVICSENLLNANLGSNTIEVTQTLKCGHSFHDFCLRGWCMIGKKNICPHCHETVNLTDLFARPWDRADMMYGSFLDTFRYFTGWLPALIFFYETNAKLFKMTKNSS